MERCPNCGLEYDPSSGPHACEQPLERLPLFEKIKVLPAPPLPDEVHEMLAKSFLWGGKSRDGCAACGDRSKKNELVDEIVNMVRFQGGFQVGGVAPFWTRFRDRLCFLCTVRLGSIDSDRRQAVELLEEAVKLDKKNQAARRNLEIARKMTGRT